MMRWISALIALAALAAMPALAGAPQTVVLDVKNMTCALCPITVKKSLENVRGVSDARINFDKKTATVTLRSGERNARGVNQGRDRCGISVDSAQVNRP